MSVVKYKIFARDRDNAAAGISEGSDKIVLKSTPDIVRGTYYFVLSNLCD